MKIHEVDRFCSKLVDIGRLQLFVTMAAEFPETLIIGKDQQDVGAVRRCGDLNQ